MAIHYREGDATRPGFPCVIAHVVNDRGGWGAGFSGALGRRFPWAETSYRAWYSGGSGYGAAARYPPFELGRALTYAVGDSMFVAHLLAQHGYRGAANPKPLQLDALDEALGRLAHRQSGWPGELAGVAGLLADVPLVAPPIVMPLIGCGLAGGSWNEVEPLIRERLGGFEVYVFSLRTR